jgi:hypothetical protein
MNENKLITEYEIEQQKLNHIKHHVQYLQQKEEFLVNIPYYDETPRLAYNKLYSPKTLFGRMFILSNLLSLLMVIPVAYGRYGILN